MKTVLITGSEGFVGTYFTKLMRETLNKIVPVCYPLLKPKKGRYVPLDILNMEMVREVVKTANPDIIFHLAAQSSVAKSFRDRPLTYSTNITGTVNLLEAAKNLQKRIKFIFVSTCEVYGGGNNLTETSQINLKNPYSVSKYAAETICREYQIEGIECVILRPFNHVGPGQSEDFVLPTLAKQIAEIEQNKRPPLIEAGNLEVKREFMNVQDVVLAYRFSLEKCGAGEVYNVSSGRGYQLADAIDIMRGFAKTKFEIRIDPTRVRKTDIPVLIGNGEKLSKATGWHVRVKFEKTLEDLLNYWRAKIV